MFSAEVVCLAAGAPTLCPPWRLGRLRGRSWENGRVLRQEAPCPGVSEPEGLSGGCADGDTEAWRVRGLPDSGRRVRWAEVWCPALGSGLLSESYQIHSCSIGGWAVLALSSWTPGLENSPQMVLSDPGPFPGKGGPDLLGPAECLLCPSPKYLPTQSLSGTPVFSLPVPTSRGEEPPVSGRSPPPPSQASFLASSLGSSLRSQPGHLGCKNIFSV